ncbi:MAG: acylneuraminate cytidylyltransferase family protein [Myxococcales bacterium]|nr:acylneuraminate cytidylyltransferase family protein [Myxococcales bacterium]
MSERRVVALIPARGGSKGVPRKNVAIVGGRPLIEWTIAAAIEAACCSRLLVSTDDEEIAAVANSAGAEVPYLRPDELARDETPTIDVVLHMANWLEQSGIAFDYLLLLQPTSPLRRADDIRGIVELAERTNAAALASVCAVEHHPLWMRTIDGQGLLHRYHGPDAPIPVRRQDLPPVYALNGALYLVRREVLLVERTLCPEEETRAYVMPRERSIDVDDAYDLTLVDRLLAAQGGVGER